MSFSSDKFGQMLNYGITHRNVPLSPSLVWSCTGRRAPGDERLRPPVIALRVSIKLFEFRLGARKAIHQPVPFHNHFAPIFFVRLPPLPDQVQTGVIKIGKILKMDMQLHFRPHPVEGLCQRGQAQKCRGAFDRSKTTSTISVEV